MPRSGCPAGTFGYPCFRDDAVRVVVAITDATTHDGPAGSDAYSDALLGFNSPEFPTMTAALRDEQVRFVGVRADRTFPTPGVLAQLRQIGRDSESVDASGSESVYDTATTTLANAIITGVEAQFELSVSARVVDTAIGDGVDPTAAFVNRFGVRPTAGMGCAGGISTRDRPMFGTTVPETFVDAPETTIICWNLVLRTNTTVARTGVVQSFPAEVEFVDERLNRIGNRELVFIVPPLIPNP
jgi:hypothetical protein